MPFLRRRVEAKRAFADLGADAAKPHCLRRKLTRD